MKAKTYRDIYIEAVGPIPKGWVVHHLNFDHDDNRPENLIALTRNQHNVLHRLIKWLPKEVVLRVGQGLVEYAGTRCACRDMISVFGGNPHSYCKVHDCDDGSGILGNRWQPQPKNE